MDLPLWFSGSSLFASWSGRYIEGSCLPLKPFQSILKMFPALESASVVPPLAAPGVATKVEDDFWIESLGVTLPGTWVDAGVVTDKAAKSDDAAIHTALWDQRILMVLPGGTRAALVSFRAWGYFLYTKLLTACYKRFMVATHGVGWAALLHKLRRLRRLGASTHGSPHRGGAMLQFHSSCLCVFGC